MSLNPALPFARQARDNPDRLALWVAGLEITYSELAGLAGRAARWLRLAARPPSRVVVFASGSVEAYAGMLAAWWTGAAWIPLSPRTPGQRLASALEILSADALILDEAAAGLLGPDLIARCPERILALGHARAPAGLDAPGRAAAAARDDLPPLEEVSAPEPVGDDELAYVMFTSGTTGIPKGVMVSAANLVHFRSCLEERYRIGRDDRVAQSSELTFDLSLLGLLLAWGAGACLCVVPETQRMGPARFIRERRLSVWVSVPSTIACMRSMKMLPPGAFPLLRYSLFVGEPLTVASAAEWQAAAPVSVVDNLYGPTEATVVCLGQRFCDSSPITRGRATVAIGAPFRGTEAAIVDGELRFLPAGDEGELVLSGPQLARGYLGDPAQTSARFPTIGGRTWYRTGDLAYRDLGGAFHHLGRMDHQVKVLGNRIELEDVEAHLRAVCGCDLVAAVAWPLEEGSARGIVAFVSGTTRSSREIAEGMRRRVPAYMVPSRVEHVESLPLGATGKIDRAALARRLEKSAPGRS